MKRAAAFLLLFCLTLFAAGCGGASAGNETAEQTEPAARITAPAETEESTQPPETAEETTLPIQETTEPPFYASDADYDITGSATVAYAGLYALLYEPEEYVGKTVCMRGSFSTYEDPFSGERFYGCVLQDVTACCTLGMEFNPAEGFSFPEDFPANGEEITVFGTFDTYEKNGFTFCTLRNALVMR